MTIRANVLRWEVVEKLEVVAKRTSPRQELTDPHDSIFWFDFTDQKR